MPDKPLPPHTIVAAIRMAGHQRATMTVHNGGTPEAYVAVAIGRSVIYLHTSTTAARFGRVWRGAQADALRLPQRRNLRGPGIELPDIAEPSIVVHAAGQPAATARLVQVPNTPMPDHLRINIGNLGFLIYDQRAFSSCAEVFLRAAAASHERLDQADLRLAPVMRADPVLAGDQAERAARSLLQGQEERSPGATPAHPAARAATSMQANRSRPPSQRKPAERRADAIPAPHREQSRVGSSAARLWLHKPQGPSSGRLR